MVDNGQRRTITRAAKGWAGFFAFLLTISLIPLLITVTLNFTLLNQQKVKQVFIDQQVYEQLPQEFLQSMVTKIETESGDSLLSQLDSEQLAEMITTLLPEGYIQSQIEVNIDAVYSVINLETTEVNLAIDLKPIKNYLKSTDGQSAFINYLNAQPDCTLEQVAVIYQATQEGNPGTTITLCKFPQEATQLIQPKVTQKMVEFSDALPDEISLASGNEPGFVDQITSSRPYQIYKLAHQMMDVLPWIAGALAAIIVLLTLRSLKTMLKSLGIPLLISGIAGGIVAFLFSYGGSALIPSSLLAYGQLGEIFKQIALAMISVVGQFGLLLCLFTTGVGFIFLIIAGLLRE
jgi:hypothetical protein